MRTARGRVRALPWRRILLATAMLTLIVLIVPPLRRTALAALGQTIVWVATPFAPDVGGFASPPVASQVVASDGSVLGSVDGGQRRQPVEPSKLPAYVTKAILAAEDKGFYHHHGVDPSAIARAALHNFGGRSEGGSTITQQLAKNNYTGSSHTLGRKVRELLYAVQLERHYTKEQLLRRYMNQVYFGDDTYGIGAASQDFFGVEPDRLTVAQAAVLAGKIHDPRRLDPRTRPAAVTTRRNEVLRAMHADKWLSAADLHAALATTLQVVPRAPGSAGSSVKAPHFVDLVKREAQGLDSLGGTPEVRAQQLVAGGLRIETTLSPKAFDAAAAAVQQQLGGAGDPTTGVVSVQPGDGAIRALVSGLDYGALQLDVTTQGHRQPGSSFKPFVYLAALRAGIDPRTPFDSASPKQLTYRGSAYTVKNYEGSGSGPMTVDEAMVHSVNTVFAQLVLQTEPKAVVTAAEDAGVAHTLDDDQNHPAVALGGLRHGVTPLEQAAAYATFAAKGVYAKPYSIVRIRDRSGRVIYSHTPQTHQVFDPRQVGVLDAALMSVVQRGTGAAAQIGRPVAGKTGTTENYADAWFVGFVPQLSTAVWVGYPESSTRGMTSVHGISVSGGSFPARIWAQMMRATMAGVPVQAIPTASPDSLDLHRTGSTSSSSPSASSSTTSTSVDGLPPDTTLPGDGSPTPVDNPPASQPPSAPPPRQTTTTRPPPPTTTSSTTSTTVAH